MTEENGMNCAEFADVAAELALGVLTGRERADALAHLDQCDACAANVRQLTTAGEALLGLLPSMEPPPGFETRVMARLGFPTPEPTPAFGQENRSDKKLSHRTRRMLAAAAAVAAVAGAGFGGWGLHAATSPSLSASASRAAPPTLTTVKLLTADHDDAGEIYVYTGSGPRWMYMSIDLDSASRTQTVICQLESADGRVTTVGAFTLANGYGAWGSPAWVGDGTPVGARLVTPDGKVLATASFPKAIS